jgi:dTDP-4-amino-4,6-dideoxygalactose transaminase
MISNIILERSELNTLKEFGYEWKDSFDIISIFEDKLSKFSGSKYAVVVDSCSSALFLTLKWINNPKKVTVPINTYPSVPMQLVHAGYDIEFKNIEWSGVYKLNPFNIWDGAGRWSKNMYNGGFHLLSFQMKKVIPIGKGGAILTDDVNAYNWLKKVRHDGRNSNINHFYDNIDTLGWHMNMIPEDAARGILLMDLIGDVNIDSHTHLNYKPLTEHNIFKNYEVIK